jgi:aminopeptidase N
MLLKATAWILLAAIGLSAQQEDLQSRPRREERSRQYDVLHYRIRLNFDEAKRAYEGETEIRLRPLHDAFDTLELDAETFRVTSVKGMTFSQTPGKLSVKLGRPYRFGEEFTVTVSYRAENVSIDPEKFGMPKGYGLGLTFKQETASHPQLFHTLSFPEGARHWFPCYDHPNDKATSEVIATVDARYQLVSNGTLKTVREDPKRKTKTFHWVQAQPHSTYLFVLVAGPYVQVTDPGGKLPVSYWVYPKDVKHAQRVFAKTRPVIDFLSRELDYPYPWAKYDQIAIPDFGGGAESTNATVISQDTLHDEKGDKDFSSEWLIAHEAAHQWWGDLLTMRDWTHTWLNESFATYYEYLYMRHLLGEEEGAVNLLSKKQTYLAETKTRYARAIVFDRWNWPNDNFDRHTYQKGGVVLSMLRSAMGEEAFRRSITHYLKKHAFGSVDTHDFQIAIREASGQVLDWFFDQWIYQPGHPVLEVRSDWNNGEVRLHVRQKQQSKFILPVTIAVTTEAGKQSHKVWIRNQEETFTFPCKDKPLLVRFDEGDILLKEVDFPKPVEELLYQLTHDNVIGRMEAAAALKPQATSNPKVADALRTAATRDPFWSVRREAIFAGGTEFLKSVAVDKLPAVRVVAIAALSETRDASLAQYFEQRFRAEDSYLAQAECLRAIGKSRGNAAFLKQAEAMPSPRDVIRKAAKAALQDLGR